MTVSLSTVGRHFREVQKSPSASSQTVSEPFPYGVLSYVSELMCRVLPVS